MCLYGITNLLIIEAIQEEKTRKSKFKKARKIRKSKEIFCLTDLEEGAILSAEVCGEGDVVALVLLDEVSQECLLAAPHHVTAPVRLHHRLHLFAEAVHAPLLVDHAVADRAFIWKECRDGLKGGH